MSSPGIETDESLPEMTRFTLLDERIHSLLRRSDTPCEMLWLRHEMKRSTHSNETIHSLSWNDEPPEMKRHTPSNETNHTLRNETIPLPPLPWGGTIHPLKWYDSFPGMKGSTPEGLHRDNLSSMNLIAEQRRLHSACAKLSACHCELNKISCKKCFHWQSLYSSVAERQSCKLKVLGSIPSEGFQSSYFGSLWKEFGF